MQALAVEPIERTEVRTEVVLTWGALSTGLIVAALVGLAIVLMAIVSPIVGDAALIFAGFVGLIDVLFVTPTRLRVDGREIAVCTVARSTTYDAYTLIARRVSRRRYALSTKTRPHRALAFVRPRDLALLREIGVDVA
jgi:hypothetical protein